MKLIERGILPFFLFVIGLNSCASEYEKLKVLAKLPFYSGEDLGLTYSPEKSSFRIWSPDAETMMINCMFAFPEWQVPRVDYFVAFLLVSGSYNLKLLRCEWVAVVDMPPREVVVKDVYRSGALSDCIAVHSWNQYLTVTP